MIAILAAITIVAYNGIQQRARDTRRIQDLAALSKSTKLYAVDNGGDYASINCGSTGNGWLTSDYDGAGPAVSINACLTLNKHLSTVLTDPSGLSSCGGLGCYAYMKGSCGTTSYYYAHLEGRAQTTTDLDGTCNDTYDTLYGMNYYVGVN